MYSVCGHVQMRELGAGAVGSSFLRQCNSSKGTNPLALASLLVGHWGILLRELFFRSKSVVCIQRWDEQDGTKENWACTCENREADRVKKNTLHLAPFSVTD